MTQTSSKLLQWSLVSLWIASIVGLAAAWLTTAFGEEQVTLTCRWELELSCERGFGEIQLSTLPALRWRPRVSWRRFTNDASWDDITWLHYPPALLRFTKISAYDVYSPPLPPHPGWPPPPPGLSYGITGMGDPTKPFPGRPARRRLGIIFPIWMPLVLAVLLPAYFLFVKRRRRLPREANLLCLRCGYDLRASTGRCPECGTAIPCGRDGKA